MNVMRIVLVKRHPKPSVKVPPNYAKKDPSAPKMNLAIREDFSLQESCFQMRGNQSMIPIIPVSLTHLVRRSSKKKQFELPISLGRIKQ